MYIVEVQNLIIFTKKKIIQISGRTKLLLVEETEKTL